MRSLGRVPFVSQQKVRRFIPSPSLHGHILQTFLLRKEDITLFAHLHILSCILFDDSSSHRFGSVSRSHLLSPTAVTLLRAAESHQHLTAPGPSFTRDPTIRSCVHAPPGLPPPQLLENKDYHCIEAATWHRAVPSLVVQWLSRLINPASSLDNWKRLAVWPKPATADPRH